MIPTLKQLISRARELYPTSRYYQHQWVRKSFKLYQNGAHSLQVGKFNRKY